MDRDPFFVNIVNFQNSRFFHEHVAAQLTLLTINGDICDIKDRNLNAMYMDNQDFDSNGDVAKKIKKVLNYLVLMFPEKTPELKRYNVVSMFSLVKDLMENYAKKDRETELANGLLTLKRNAPWRRRSLKMSKILVWQFINQKRKIQLMLWTLCGIVMSFSKKTATRKCAA